MIYEPDYLNFPNRLEESGYKVFRRFPDKPLNLNIVGWRNRQGRVNHFDDFIGLYWQDKKEWLKFIFPATTRPGSSYLLNPVNPKGTAILVPGQYESVYQLGKYKGQDALIQTGPLEVFRDDNKDQKFDYVKPDYGLFGIHIHRAGFFTKLVGPSSAGCQVFQSSKDFIFFIKMIKLALKYWPNSFSYTLVEF